MLVVPLRAPHAARRSLRLASWAAALSLALSACGSDTPGTAPDTTPPVSTVVLNGAPTGSLLVGATVQLAATGLSATGSTIPAAAMTWRSSNEAVATVGVGGLVTARGAGQTTISVTSGAGSAAADVFVQAPLTVTAAGGTVSLPGDALTLTVPPGAVQGSLTLLAAPAPGALADAKVVPGSLYELSSAASIGTLGATTVSIRYDPARLPAGVTAGSVQLYVRRATGWTVVRGSTSDPARAVVTGTFAGTGVYAVRGTAVDRVVLGGGAVDGALYVGQSTTLTAAALSAFGDTLAGRTLTWTSSDASVLRVDAQGDVTATVTATGAGSATITATSEGVSATTQLAVLARPTAEWSATGEWTSYRGGSRRTGYVAATLDPVVFARRWEVTLGINTALNEPATGDGNVYVSTSSYFGGQALYALDPATGTERWTRAFGSIHSVNGPATGPGRVYVSTGGHEDSFLWAFAAATGAVQFRTPYGNQWSRWYAPAVTSDIVYLGGGYYGGMAAFSVADGTRLWTKSLPQTDEWTPAADGGKVYVFGSDVGYNAPGLMVIDGRTGTGPVRMGNMGLPNAGTPVLGDANDLLVIRGPRLLALDLGRDAVAWDRAGSYVGSPAVGNGAVYAVVNGQVEARRESDGGLLWVWVPPAGAAAAGSVVATRNLVFARLGATGFSGAPARTVAIDAAARRIVWSYPAAGELALSNGTLYIAHATGGKLTAISVR